MGGGEREFWGGGWIGCVLRVSSAGEKGIRRGWVAFEGSSRLRSRNCVGARRALILSGFAASAGLMPV